MFRHLNRQQTIELFLHLFLSIVFVLIPFFYLSEHNGDVRAALPPPHSPGWDTFWVKHYEFRFCIRNLIFLGLFYFVYLYLTPSFLLHKRKLLLFLFFSVTSVVVCIFILSGYHNLIDEVIGKGNLPFTARFINNYLYCIGVVALSAMLRIYKNYQELRLTQAESELQFLRSQINPHFLFNSLNSIYSLIVLKSDKAADAMVKLSDLMRFVLYDSSGKFVLLSKELKYIENYIELQRIRYSDDVAIIAHICYPDKELMIHPMLLVPFIENAFKHGVSYEGRSKIEVTINAQEETLIMEVKNNVVKTSQKIEYSESGIGLKNVIQRLNLLYKSRHELKTNVHNGLYVVNLNIKLNAA